MQRTPQASSQAEPSTGWSITIKHLRLIVWDLRIERVGVMIYLLIPGKYGLSRLSSQSMIYLKCLDNLALHYVPLATTPAQTPFQISIKYCVLSYIPFYNNYPSASCSRKRNRRPNILNIHIMLYIKIIREWILNKADTDTNNYSVRKKSLLLCGDLQNVEP